MTQSNEARFLEDPSGQPSRRMPGPAEAGLLFSLTAFLQLYAVRWLGRIAPSATLQVFLAEIGFIALPALLLAILMRFGIRDAFRLVRPRIRDVGFLTLMTPVAMLAAYSAGILAIVLVKLLFGSLQLSGDMGDILDRGLPMAVLTIGVVPAVCEEWMFRGFFQRGMESFGSRKAVLLSGVLFGLFHFDFQRFAAQALLGVVIAYVVYRSGSLFNGMLIHFLHNAGSVVISNLAGGMEAFPGILIASAGGAVSGDIFAMPVIQEYASQLGISMDALIRSMAAGSAFVLACSLLVLFGLLLVFRHMTREVARPPARPSPRRACLTILPGLLLILLVYAAIALNLMGHPASETLMRILFRPVVS